MADTRAITKARNDLNANKGLRSWMWLIVFGIVIAMFLVNGIQMATGIPVYNAVNSDDAPTGTNGLIARVILGVLAAAAAYWFYDWMRDDGVKALMEDVGVTQGPMPVAPPSAAARPYLPPPSMPAPRPAPVAAAAPRGPDEVVWKGFTGSP